MSAQDPILGIDVSKWQSRTPRLDGYRFLIARATIGTQKDERYDQHIDNARNAGIITGAYHFNWDTIPIGEQVDAFIKAAGDVDLYALDVEGANAFSRHQTELFIASFKKKTGKKIGLYMSLSAFYDAGQDWHWVAYWSDRQPQRAWDIWQFGPINGIDGNQFNGTLAELKALAGARTTGDDSMAQLPITDLTPKLIDIPVGARRFMLDGSGPDLVFQQLYRDRFSPYGVGQLRAYYATVDDKKVLRLVEGTNIRDIPVPADATPFSQADIDAAKAVAEAKLTAAHDAGVAAERDRVSTKLLELLGI
jgi:lysozyme